MSKLVDMNNLPCPNCLERGFKFSEPCPHCGFQIQLPSEPTLGEEITRDLHRQDWEKNWVPRFEQAAEDRGKRDAFRRDWPVALDLIKRKAGDRAWKKAGLDRAEWEYQYKIMGSDQILARLANRKDQE